MTIPMEEWRWYGMPGHFIASTRCCFHMTTDIGAVRVSTVGCYHLTGDEPSYETRHPIGAGADSLYETYVFAIDPNAPARNELGTQSDLLEGLEIEGERWATEAEAEAGHMRYCHRWATKEQTRTR